LLSWGERDTHFPENERLILQRWDFSKLTLLKEGPSNQSIAQISPEFWTCSPDDFIKLNFDGAPKGNSCPTRFGGVFHNHHGAILHPYSGYIGKDNNNTT